MVTVMRDIYKLLGLLPVIVGLRASANIIYITKAALMGDLQLRDSQAGAVKTRKSGLRMTVPYNYICFSVVCDINVVEI